MLIVKKKKTIAVSHKLDLPYESDCNNLHGHNLDIVVEMNFDFQDVERNDYMSVDFKFVSEIIDSYDHKDLNDLTGWRNPTAEYLAERIAKEILEMIKVNHEVFSDALMVKVSIQESPGNIIIYELENRSFRGLRNIHTRELETDEYIGKEKQNEN